MGFRVGIDDNADALLKLLRSNPAQVFDRPYKGYLLFLAGAADQEVCEWLAQNAIVLDSLTGEDIAFAVFARTFRMRIHASHPKPPRPPMYVGAVSSEEITGGSWQVTRLVKSGRCGWVVDGDEIAAVTYAVDDLARSFNVLQHLPCIVVLDAIPSKKLNIVRLSLPVRECLVEVLRKAMARFSAMPGYLMLEGSVDELLKAHQAINSALAVRPTLERELQQEKDWLAHAVAVGPVDHSVRNSIIFRLMYARESLRKASLRRFREALTGSPHGLKARKCNPLPGLDQATLIEVLDCAESNQLTIWRITNTINALRVAQASSEPERSERFARIFRSRASQIIPSIESIHGCSNLDIDGIINTLEYERENIINNIMLRVPRQETLVSNLTISEHALYEHELEKINNRIHNLENRIEKLLIDPELEVRDLKERYALIEKRYLRENRASFWESISQSLMEMRLGAFAANAKTTATSIAAGVFRPDFLIKIWEAFPH